MALRQASAERDGSRGATAGTGRAGCGPIVEVPRSVLSTLKARFVSSARARLETALLAGRRHRGMECRQRLWMSITGSSSDVATTPRARKRKLLPHAGHEFGLWRREVSWEGGLSRKSQQSPVVSPPAACPPTVSPPVAASRRLPAFAFVVGRDGRPELVIRGEHPWLVSSRQAMPVLPRRRHEIGQPVQEVTRREFDDAVSTRACGLPPAPRAWPRSHRGIISTCGTRRFAGESLSAEQPFDLAEKVPRQDRHGLGPVGKESSEPLGST